MLNVVERQVRPHRTPQRTEVERLMKRCQIGVGGRNALEAAHGIMADCYGTLGLLMLCVEWRGAALEWIDGATAATHGLTDAELGRALWQVGKKAREALRPNELEAD